MRIKNGWRVVVWPEESGESVWDVYHKSIVRGNMKRVNMILVSLDLEQKRKILQSP